MCGNGKQSNQYAEVFRRVKIEDKTHIPGGMSIEDLCATPERFHKMNSSACDCEHQKDCKKLYEQLKKDRMAVNNIILVRSCALKIGR